MKFEGDVEDLSDVNKKHLEEILNNNGINVESVNVGTVGKKGDNYVADVKRITVHDSDKGTIKMIVKLAPTLEAVRNMVNTKILFRNEIVMYADTFPEFVNVQKLAGIPHEENLEFPKYYGSYKTAPNELLVLEDLKVLGYEIRDRLVSLTDQEIRMVLKSLAKLHAASFASKDKDPESFARLAASLVDAWSTDDKKSEAVKVAFDQLEEHIVSLMDSQEEKQSVRGILNQVATLSAEASEYDVTSRHSVIIHGDCWTNNILFKREEDKYTECIMIDYQMSKYASPAFDLLYLIFNCTDEETRNKNFEEWIDHYHKSIDGYLASYSLNASHIYPRDQLDIDLRRNSKLLFGIGVLVATVLTRESDECFDFKKIAEDQESGVEGDMVTNLTNSTASRMKTKIQGLISSCKRYGYL